MTVIVAVIVTVFAAPQLVPVQKNEPQGVWHVKHVAQEAANFLSQTVENWLLQRTLLAEGTTLASQSE